MIRIDELRFSIDGQPLSPSERQRAEAHLSHALDELERSLGPERGRTRSLYFSVGWPFRGMASSLVRRAEALTRRVWEQGGRGAHGAEGALLMTIAAAADPGSLPFLRECLERTIPRDAAGPARLGLALVAIANLARGGDAEARAELRAHLGSVRPDTRAAAVRAADCVFAAELPGDVHADIERIARSDDAFAPRFLARRLLVELGDDPIIDVPSGSYRLAAALRGARGASRTVEVRSTQCLRVLAGGILAAHRWDHDHLYCFHFDERDRHGPFTVGAEDEPWPSSGEGEGARGPHEALGGLDAPIGSLGLFQGQRFLFRFDFGAGHLFDVTVAGIEPVAPRRVKLPRVVARTGNAPAQYRW